MLQRHAVHVLGFFVLADFPAPQGIPTVIRCHLVKPRRERSARIVLAQLVAQLREYFHRGVFRVFARWQRPPAEPENRRSELPIECPPGLGVPCLGPRDHLDRFGFARGAHPAWSQRFHTLIRSRAPKSYANLT